MTNAEIVETPDGSLPLKVVFSKDGEPVAERAVTSELAGQELIANLLPLLRKHDA
jgi:hypothetical protein